MKRFDTYLSPDCCQRIKETKVIFLHYFNDEVGDTIRYKEEKPFKLSSIYNVSIEKDNKEPIMISMDKEKLYKKIIKYKHAIIKKCTDFILESMTKITIIEG